MSTKEFILALVSVLRGGWRARIATVTVVCGVAILTPGWIEPFVSHGWQFLFDEPISFTEVPTWYGLALIISGMFFAIWVGREEWRAQRSRSGWRRPALLDQLAQESIGRCAARLVPSMASKSVVDALVSRFDELPDLAEGATIPPCGKVVVLTGPLGSGKSFAAEKLFRLAVKQARKAGARVPVYVNARKVGASLRLCVEHMTEQLADATVVGATIIVDQVDELPVQEAKRVYEDAVSLVRSWPNTGAVLVARWWRWKPTGDTVVHMREMTWNETDHLMGVVSGGSTADCYWSLPEVVQRSAQRPLISILLARYIMEQPANRAVSVGRLIEWMVRRALTDIGSELSESVEALLRTLAVQLTDARTSVRVRDVSSDIGAVERLLATRLVNVDGDDVDFGLPVLRQWFAYAALRERDVSVEELVEDPVRLDRWTDVLATAVELDQEDVDELLEPIARRSPGVASAIVAVAVERQQAEQVDGALSAREFGGQLRRSMAAFVSGLGRLGGALGPVTERGDVRALGVKRTGGGYLRAWYEGDRAIADVVELPERSGEQQDEWPVARWRRGGLASGWAWLEAKAELSEELERRLETFGLPIEHPVFLHELGWKLARCVLDRSTPFESAISIDDLSDVVDGNWRRGMGYRGYIDRETLPTVLSWLRRLVRQGQPLEPPWPGPDRAAPEGGVYLWDFYSSVRLQSRLSCVLNAALAIYSELVRVWFPAMERSCQRFALMPVRLVAYLVVDRGDRGPMYAYYLEPLEEGQTSCAEVRLESIDHNDLWERATSAWPQGPVSTYAEGVRVFGSSPATNHAIRWLTRELAEVNWTRGSAHIE